MAARKNFPIERLRGMVNHYNIVSPDEAQVAREAQNALLEVVLMESRAYKGFAYVGEYVEGMDESRRLYI